MTTVEEIKRYERVRCKEHVEDILQLLHLRPPESPVHSVETYRDGVRIPIQLTGLKVYVYVLPWARGWTIFTTPQDNAACPDWRFVPKKWSAFQRPVYNPRHSVGPWHSNPIVIANAVEYLAGRVAQIERRRVPQLTHHQLKKAQEGQQP